MEAGADPKALDASGTTPLHDAVSAEVVAALLEAGADMEAGDPHGMTPLDHAARGGRAEVVAALLEAGADLEERNAYEMTRWIMRLWRRAVAIIMSCQALASTLKL